MQIKLIQLSVFSASLFPRCVLEADGVSCGEDSFDPDEGFSSGASSSSQPSSVKRDWVITGVRPFGDPVARQRESTSADTRAVLRSLHQSHQSPPPAISLRTAESIRSPSPSAPRRFLDPHYIPPFAGAPPKTGQHVFYQVPWLYRPKRLIRTYR